MTGDNQIPPPGAMRGMNQQQQRPSPFIPLDLPTGRMQRPAQMAPPPAPMQMPELTFAKPTNEWGDLLKGVTSVVQKRQDALDEIDRHKKLEELQELLRKSGASGAPSGSPAESAMPQGTVKTSAPGSYEEKVEHGESGGDPNALNAQTGTAGLYQFAPSTAEGIRQQHPELGITDQWRTNRDDQKKLMKVYTDTSREILRKQLGRDPTGGELYMLHMFGHGKGPQILANLQAPLTQTTSDQERAYNPFLNDFSTGQALLESFNKRFS